MSTYAGQICLTISPANRPDPLMDRARRQWTAPTLASAYLDSDGQCDPRDFPRFWTERERSDVVIGHRVNRQDTTLRRAMSRSFYLVYKLLYRVPVHDPSCPYVLARHDVIAAIAPDMREMQQGYWWEFVARVHRRGYSILELPVNHRLRAAGETQIYRLGKLPGIGFRHAVALGKIWYQTR